MFATELVQAYPEVKVILNQRPVDDWYRSLLSSMDAMKESSVSRIIVRLDREDA